mmetsp:Transcript_23088/g.54567  ORF Transcript_23088/g.54567 Transcript_23088/m.54567 type:complete len:816 (+) Transcript_23088:120-2567(+)
MSRRGRGSAAAKKLTANGPPTSHPSETNREHRKFLIRSLERNDVDINALIKLNKSLHKAKRTLLRCCSERVLLDLGSGRLKLINGKLHDTTIANNETMHAATRTVQQRKNNYLTPNQNKICVDFLLRMKLRRKLSNRLIRRLTRVAHAMDGNDVSPPPPPKYGDLRFQIDQNSVASHYEDWKEKTDARKRIQQAVDSDLLDSTCIRNNNEEEKERNFSWGEVKEESTQFTTTASNEKQNVGDFPVETQSSDNANREAVNCISMIQAEKALPGSESTSISQSEGGKSDYTSSPFLDHFKRLEEFENAYEKTWDTSTKSFNCAVTNDENRVREFEKLTKGVCIGASSVFPSIDSLQAEYKRWQTNILRKIPKQPTLDELGLKNRVLFLKERRKRCLEEKVVEDEVSSVGENQMRKNAKSEENSTEYNFDKDVEIKSSNESEHVENEDDNNESDEDGTTRVNDTNTDELHPKKSISFAAIPSFHDQELARIRMIHRDLLISSQAELTRKRLTDATNEYNLNLQLSTQLFDARQMVQQSLSFTIAKGRQELSKAHSDYTIAYTTAKQLWLKEKFEYDMKKSQAVLPTKWGSQPLGTEMIKEFMQSNCSNIQLITVSQTLADIVDGSILAAKGKAPIQRFKDFVPPPAPGMNAKTGENMAQRQHRVEMEYRKQYDAIDEKFQKSEGDRIRAWRKVMKAQAEINSVASGSGKGVRITMSNYHQFPVPSIRSSNQQNIPRQYTQQPNKQSYSPSVSTNTTSLTDTSKYSAAKVKQRKSADGTVAPVSEPKKTKDGLYLRPAGRTRKGMEWDAINGVWVPQRS